MQPTQPFDEPDDVRVRLIVEPLLEVERPRTHLAAGWRRRIVAQFGVVHHEIECIDPEPVDPAVEPELGDVQQGVLHLRMVPVQLRLLRQEIVQEILPPPRIPGPGRTAEHRLPVAGRRAVGLGIGPDVPVSPRIVAAGAAVHEPAMLVRGMGIDLVDDHPQPQPMSARDQRVEIAKRAEDRVDITVIRYVVTEILHRRGKERRYPDRVDPEIGDMIQTFGNAAQVTDPVTVGIAERARIDLVDGRAAPPLGAGIMGRSGDGRAGGDRRKFVHGVSAGLNGDGRRKPRSRTVAARG